MFSCFQYVSNFFSSWVILLISSFNRLFSFFRIVTSCITVTSSSVFINLSFNFIISSCMLSLNCFCSFLFVKYDRCGFLISFHLPTIGIFLILNHSCVQDAIKFNIFSFSCVIRNINFVVLSDI